jgi:hypothetical protein
MSDIGASLREFFSNLFGSRLAGRLEYDIDVLRSDFQSRIEEYKLQLAELKSDKAVLQAKLERYESVVIPLSSRAGADLSRKPLRPNFGETFNEASLTPWQQKQREFDQLQAAEEKDSAAAKA